MSKQYEYNGHTYWVTVEPTVHESTGEAGFIAFVSDEKPSGMFYGNAVRDEEGNIMFFTTELVALTNANGIKQSELGRQ